MRAHDGVTELLSFLRSHDIKLALYTRNSARGIVAMKDVTGYSFDIELSRDFEPTKPCTTFRFLFLTSSPRSIELTLSVAPEGALHIAQSWNLDPSSILFVGDSGDDIKCGNSAGMKSVLFDPESKRTNLHNLASLVITSMTDLQGLLEIGIVL